MEIAYLASFLLTFLLVGGFLFGGIFWGILELMFAVIMLYSVYRVAKRLKGDTVLNFFAVLYALSALINFVIIYVLGLTGDAAVLSLNSIVFVMAFVFKFLQGRKILTAILVVHTSIIVAFLALGTTNVDTIFGSLVRIFINIAMILYVNFLREFMKGIEQAPAPPRLDGPWRETAAYSA